MPNVKFGFTTKRVNSTRNSYGGAGTTLSCRLKEPTSIYNPVFEVQGLSGTNFNYCNMGDLYYWIDDIIHTTNNIIEVHCHLDPYGTWRDVIKNRGKGYVTYCGDDTYWNKEVDDTRFQPECMEYEDTTSFKGTEFTGFSSDITFDVNHGTVILACMSYYANGGGSIDSGLYFYAMSYSCIQKMFADLESVFSQSGGTFDFDEFAQKLVCAMGGTGTWVDNIISITWLPIALSCYSSIGTQFSSYIYVGGIECSIPSGETVYAIQGINYKMVQKTVAKPFRPIQTDLPFTKTERWCQMQLVYPGGCQAIDMSMIKGEAPLYWNSCIDMVTGEWCGKLKSGENEGNPILATVGGTLGVDIGHFFSTRGSNEAFGAMIAGGIFGGIMSGSLSGVLSGGDVVSAVKGVPTGMGIGGAVAQSGVRTPQFSGGLGNGGIGFCCVKDTINIGKFFLNVTVFIPEEYAHNNSAGDDYVEYCDNNGYPCNKFLHFNDIADGSYVKTYNASFLHAGSMTGIPYEYITEINSALNNTGLYLE